MPATQDMAGERYFCMIHEGRCGSSVLASIIDQHPAIVHFSEILTPGAWISHGFEHSGLEVRRDASEIRLSDLNEYIDAVSKTAIAVEKPDQLYVSFEIKLNQLSRFCLDCDLPSLLKELSRLSDDVRFMFLARRNTLRRHISTLRCLYNGVSHTTDITALNRDKVRIEAGETMRDWSYDFEKWHASITDVLEISETRRLAVRNFALAHDHLYMEYEDFEQDPLTGAGRIFDFLDIPRIQAQSSLMKTGDRPLSDLIENYEEVRDLLAKTRWEFMLD